MALFLLYSCPYRFPYFDNTLIDTSIAARARTFLIRSNIVPTKMAADQLWPRIFLDAHSSVCVYIYIYVKFSINSLVSMKYILSVINTVYV